MTKRTYTFGPSLQDITMKLLLDTAISVRRISIELRVPYIWLIKFRDGKIKDPSVNRVQALYEFLKGEPLFLVEE